MTRGPQLQRARALTAAKRDALILDVAAMCASRVVDDGECVLCGETDKGYAEDRTSIAHAEGCPFRGVSEADIRSIANEAT